MSGVWMLSGPLEGLSRLSLLPSCPRCGQLAFRCADLATRTVSWRCRCGWRILWPLVLFRPNEAGVGGPLSNAGPRPAGMGQRYHGVVPERAI